MTPTSMSAYEVDMQQQAEALERAAKAVLDDGLCTLDLKQFDRIILTGMGSSDSVTIPLELSLARQGLPVWRVQTSQLIEMPALISDRTLLWITSQSGRSGEVVALLSLLEGVRGITRVALTNDPESPLARAADHVLLLHSGPEATVSCKSYVNSLAMLHRIQAAFTGRSDQSATDEILETAGRLRSFFATGASQNVELAQRILAPSSPKIALVGVGEDAATALTGALILKEAAKVSAEGFVGGAFRHGPMEIAGANLAALLFGSTGDGDATIGGLARDLSKTGSTVISIAPQSYVGAEPIIISSRSTFDRLVFGMVQVQTLSVNLAKCAGIVPGEFRFGQKITSSL